MDEWTNKNAISRLYTKVFSVAVRFFCINFVYSMPCDQQSGRWEWERRIQFGGIKKKKKKLARIPLIHKKRKCIARKKWNTISELSIVFSWTHINCELDFAYRFSYSGYGEKGRGRGRERGREKNIRFTHTHMLRAEKDSMARESSSDVQFSGSQSQSQSLSALYKFPIEAKFFT